MADRDYSHREVVDKLGIKTGCVVAFADHAASLAPELTERVLARAGRPAARADETADVVLIGADVSTDTVPVLRHWRSRIRPNGGIWLLTPKRGQPGYVDQRDLIPAGMAAELVDNKTCSVSETTSGMRFVIRKKDRATAR